MNSIFLKLICFCTVSSLALSAYYHCIFNLVDTMNNNTNHVSNNEVAPVDPVDVALPPLDDLAAMDEEAAPVDPVAGAPPSLEGFAVMDGHITMETVRDNIVSESTTRSYIPDILNFLFWCRQFMTDCLTQYCVDRIDAFIAEYPGRDIRFLTCRSKERFKVMLRNASTTPLLIMERLNPQKFMSYIITLCRKDGGFLSKSSYGQKRSALNHLYRCHNNTGFPTGYYDELSDLYNGFFRQLASLSEENRRLAAVEDNAINVIPWNQEEGKEPMSVELLVAICGWLLNMGTTGGIFAHCYLLLTWNLACRSNNTANIKFSDIVWSTSFDSFHILFRHSKTDQKGDDSKYPRHIFANPKNPVVCPVLSLCFYFTCCFATKKISQTSFLFPGKAQQKRFSDILQRVLKEHEEEVRITYGFEINKLGPHSIRKGAASYLCSLPGGPPGAAVCHRGGWSIGGVKDRYWHYMESGDQFVGRCLALLPIMDVVFACSPPYFDVEIGTDDDVWVNQRVYDQFPRLSHIVGFGRLCRMCVASLLYHREWLENNLNVNHRIFSDSPVFRDDHIRAKLRDNPTLLVVTYPWNDNVHAFSGVPPHAALLQEVSHIRSNQLLLLDTFVDRVGEAMTRHGYGPNRLTDESLRHILREFKEEFSLQVQRVVRLAEGETQDINGNRALLHQRVEAEKKYELHAYGGKLHKVPIDWRIPRCSTMSLWRQWWTGDTDKNVPPIRSLNILDIKHLDNVPLSQFELTSRPGPTARGGRRSQSRELSDVRFLMNYMTDLVKNDNAMADVITTNSVDMMFQAIAPKLVSGARHPQKLWSTVLKEVRKSLR